MARGGVLEDGVVSVSDRGTGQGSAVSPLLANVYLHYAFDLWADRWRRREASGNVVIVRYAEDIVVGFEREADARRFQDAMRERLAAFALSLHPDKTRLIEFGRFAAANRKRRGLGKPDTGIGVSMNHKTLADFREVNGTVLEGLLVDSFAAILRSGIASLERVAQDGVRVRASAGAASFRRRSTLKECQVEAVQHGKVERSAEP